MSVFAELSSLPTCCGVYELGRLTENEEETDGSGEINLEADDWAELLEGISTGLPQRYSPNGKWVIQCWFKNDSNWDGTPSTFYDNDELKILVEQIDGVVDLGVTINPNTGNRIHGYMWHVGAGK